MALRDANLVTNYTEKLIIWDEGVTRKVYTDTTGNPTIGIGRNLRGKGITVGEALYLFAGDMLDARVTALSYLGGNIWGQLSEVRRAVLVDMAYNLGNRIKHFRRLKRRLSAADYVHAAEELLDSRWARQVGTRAIRLAKMMRTNSWPPALRLSIEDSQ